MNSWELARYLIDAKKNIDSLMFINDNFDELSNIEIYEEIRNIQTSFYLNLCFVLDYVYDGKKKEICSDNNIIRTIYRERDKDKAHKDKDYKKIKYSSINEMIDLMITQICQVKEVCTSKLPEILTLDFVPHDKKLFRLINGLNKNKENEIKSKKYKNVIEPKIIDKKIFNDTEDLKNIKQDEKKDYAVIIKDGINLYEGIQERQDALIKLNALFGGNLWCEFNNNMRKKVEKLLKSNLINKYGMPLEYSQINEEKIKLFNKIINEVD